MKEIETATIISVLKNEENDILFITMDKDNPRIFSLIGTIPSYEVNEAFFTCKKKELLNKEIYIDPERYEGTPLVIIEDTFNKISPICTCRFHISPAASNALTSNLIFDPEKII